MRRGFGLRNFQRQTTLPSRQTLLALAALGVLAVWLLHTGAGGSRSGSGAESSRSSSRPAPPQAAGSAAATGSGSSAGLGQHTHAHAQAHVGSNAQRRPPAAGAAAAAADAGLDVAVDVDDTNGDELEAPLDLDIEDELKALHELEPEPEDEEDRGEPGAVQQSQSSATAGAGSAAPAAGISTKPKIAIVSMYFDSSAPLRIYTEPSKKIYAQRHGYTYLNAYQEAAVQQRVSSTSGGAAEENDKLFSKIQGLLFYLEEEHSPHADLHFDWLYWSDADALFLNHSIPLEPFVEHVPPGVDLIVPAGPPHSQRWKAVMNTGAFFLRNSAWSRAYLRAVWEYRRLPCDPSVPLFNGWLTLCGAKCCEWGEQGAMMQILQRRPEWQPHVRYVGFRDFNSLFPWWAPGDLVVHLHGKPLEERKRLFELLLADVDFVRGTVTKRSADDPHATSWERIPAAIRPVHSKDHLRNMDYSALNTLNPDHPR